MTQTMRKTLGFSEPFMKVEYLQGEQSLLLSGKTIVFNLDEAPISIGGKLLGSWKSSIYSSVLVPSPTKLICITLNNGSFYSPSFPHHSQLTQKWSPAYGIFQLPHLKDTKLWRSDKERIGNFEFNLWYAAAGTNCGIHNKHNFRELHTQIFGIGRMQKFHQNDYATLYQDVFMSPGFTHEPFYDENGMYPWHQYWADTDCIWLATELYEN